MKRRHQVLSASIGLAVTVALTVPSTASGALVFSGSVVLDTPGYWYGQPHIGGRYIATYRARNDGTDRDVVVYDRQSPSTPLVHGAGDGIDQHYTDVSGSRVVWISNAEADGEVWYDDLSNATPPARITTDTRDDAGSVIDGNTIAWVDGLGSGRKIRFYDLERHAAGVVDACNLPNGLCVDSGRLAWMDDEKVAGKQGVYVYDTETTAEITVREVDSSVRRIVADSVDIHGDAVTWSEYLVSTDDKNIWVANVRTGVVAQVTNNVATQTSPAISGDLLPWQDDRTGDNDILAWWGPETPGYQDVATTAANEAAPDVYGHAVAYIVDPGSDSDIALATAALEPQRISGANRYETSAKISANRFIKSGTAVLATGVGFADALAASGLAGALESPLLLSAQNDLPAPISAELERLDTTFVFVIGGEAAIGTAVTDELDDMGISWQRIAGSDRYETAARIVPYLVDIMGNENRWWRRDAFFVRGDDFADALAIAPHAYAIGVPVLLVRKDSVPAVTAQTVANFNINDGYVIGGTAAISTPTAEDIGDLLGDAAVRWWGANRYATAIECARQGVSRGWLDYDRVGVATGMDFPDALSGGAACGYFGSPLLLTPPSSIPEDLDDFLGTTRYELGGMEVYGGEAVVSPYVFGRLDDYLY